MSVFLAGAMVGVAFGIGLFCATWRHLPASRRALVSLLGGGPAAPTALPPDVVQDVRLNDPALAQVLETAPAVAVEELPQEVTKPAQEAIERAPSEAEAVEAAKRFIRDPSVAKAVVTLVRWRTRKNNSEQAYQNSFRTFASRNGYSGAVAEKPRIPWGGGGGSRVAVPDLVLDDRVLVELKADLEGSGETDRAMGQMLRYLLAWKSRGPAVLAVCGRVSPELRFLVRIYVDTWRRQLNLPVTVFFKQDEEVLEGEAVDMPTEAPRLESGR